MTHRRLTEKEHTIDSVKRPRLRHEGQMTHRLASCLRAAGALAHKNHGGQFSKRGVPDLYVSHKWKDESWSESSWRGWIEVKIGSGKLSPDQERFCEELASRDDIVLLLRLTVVEDSKSKSSESKKSRESRDTRGTIAVMASVRKWVKDHEEEAVLGPEWVHAFRLPTRKLCPETLRSYVAAGKELLSLFVGR